MSFTPKNNPNDFPVRSNRIMGFPCSLILKFALLAGTVDILSAFLYSYIKRGTAPADVLQYIAKVALGKSTFYPQGSAGTPTVLAIMSLLVHFAIAFSWTVLFFFLYSRINLMRQNKIATGIVYSLFIWAMMSIVILPLWNNKTFVFKAENASIRKLQTYKVCRAASPHRRPYRF